MTFGERLLVAAQSAAKKHRGGIHSVLNIPQYEWSEQADKVFAAEMTEIAAKFQIWYDALPNEAIAARSQLEAVIAYMQAKAT